MEKERKENKKELNNLTYPSLQGYKQGRNINYIHTLMTYLLESLKKPQKEAKKGERKVKLEEGKQRRLPIQ